MNWARADVNDADIDLKRLFVAIWQRWLIVLPLVLLAGFAAYGVVSVMHPFYKADTRILIQARNGLTGTADAGGDQAIIDDQGVKSQVQVIELADLIRKVIDKLDLASRPEFGAAAKSASFIERILARFHLASAPKARPSEQDVIDRFTSRLNVYQVASSRVIVIEFSSWDPKLAAEVPNDLADAYLRRQSGLKLADDDQAAAWLQPEIARLRKRVDAAESKVADYRAKSGLLSVGNNDTLASRELGDMASELSKVRSQRADAEARAANVREALKADRGIDTLANVVDSPLIQQLRQKEVAAQAELADLATSLGSRHPRILAVKSQIAELGSRIKAESRKVLSSLENEASIAKLREQELKRQMNELKQNSGRAGESQVKLEALQREAAADRDLLSRYLARYRAASSRSSPDALPADARIISGAVTPAKPYFPKTVPIVIVAMLATFLLASVWIMLAELFSGRALRPVETVPAIRSRRGATGADARLAGRRSLRAGAGRRRLGAGTRVGTARTCRSPGARCRRTGRRGGLLDRRRGGPSHPQAADNGGLRVPRGRRRIGGVRHPRAPARRIGHARRSRRSHADRPADPAHGDATRPGGITDVLARKSGFAEAIHGDRISPAHLMPRGMSDPDRAMRAAERLPMILDGLRDAYQIVLVECGASEVSAVRRLVRNGADFDLVMSAVEPTDDRVFDALSEFHDAGYDDILVMMPEWTDAGSADGSHAA